MSRDTLYHVKYTDGTYAECIAQDAEEADDIMARSDKEFEHGSVKGPVPRGVEVDRYYSH